MMERDQIEQLLYGSGPELRRFTQDFPVLPDVWIAYAADEAPSISLLLTPHNQSDAASMVNAMRARIDD
jgi:hypothetical protein